MHIEDDKYWREAARLPYSDSDMGDGGDSNPSNYSSGRSSSGVMREVIETIVITLLIFFVVRAVIQNFKVEGDSMLPTLHTDEYLLVNKGLYFRYDADFLAHLTDPSAPTDLRYLFHGPQRGDIIVFNSPVEPKDYIKRVIAVEGETVQIKKDDSDGDPTRPCDCGVYVNNVKLDEPYILARPDYDYGPIVIPEGHILVLGDNRRNSSDSHVWGPLDVSAIIGTAFVSYWPQDHWGLLTHPSYAAIEDK